MQNSNFLFSELESALIFWHLQRPLAIGVPLIEKLDNKKISDFVDVDAKGTNSKILRSKLEFTFIFPIDHLGRDPCKKKAEIPNFLAGLESPAFQTNFIQLWTKIHNSATNILSFLVKIPKMYDTIPSI